MAWLVLNLDDESDYDYIYYEEPEETLNNGGVAQSVERLPCLTDLQGTV